VQVIQRSMGVLFIRIFYINITRIYNPHNQNNYERIDGQIKLI